MLKALTKTRGLYERWRVGEDGSEFRTPEEQEWTATELKNSLRSIEWDVEDLEDTIQVKNYIRILSIHYLLFPRLSRKIQQSFVLMEQNWQLEKAS